MTHHLGSDVLTFIDRLAETGSNYRIEEMDELYAENLGFLVLAGDGSVVRLSKDQMFSEFRSRRDAGEPPLSTEKRVLHVEERDDEAVAILYRRMSTQADPAFYELRLRKTHGRWQVVGETVTPWPDLAKAKGFLPPRVSSR